MSVSAGLADAHVLGRFLELSIATPDIQASLHFYAKLGFSETPVGEAWRHPYAVVTDGRIYLGLHQAPEFATSVTFVRPDLLKHLGVLDKRGLSFEFRHLGNDVFNEVGWLDPSGNLVRLVEARTFSPSTRKSLETSACGYFLEIALPAAGRDQSKDFWERSGFVGMHDAEALLPHVTCTSDSIDIGLYEPTHVLKPTLLFELDDLAAAAAELTALDLRSGARLPAPLCGTAAMMLTAPEGTPLLLTAAALKLG